MSRQTIAVVLVAQALAFAAWWVVIVVAPSSRAYFHVHESSLLAFWLADAAVIATAIVAAYGVTRERPWAPHALWLVAGGTSYAALYCVALWLTTGAGVLATIAMVPAAGIAIVVARAGSR